MHTEVRFSLVFIFPLTLCIKL